MTKTVSRNAPRVERNANMPQPQMMDERNSLGRLEIDESSQPYGEGEEEFSAE